MTLDEKLGDALDAILLGGEEPLCGLLGPRRIAAAPRDFDKRLAGQLTRGLETDRRIRAEGELPVLAAIAIPDGPAHFAGGLLNMSPRVMSGISRRTGPGLRLSRVRSVSALAMEYAQGGERVADCYP
jgi:hypothetical protein